MPRLLYGNAETHGCANKCAQATVLQEWKFQVCEKTYPGHFLVTVGYGRYANWEAQAPLWQHSGTAGD